MAKKTRPLRSLTKKMEEIQEEEDSKVKLIHADSNSISFGLAVPTPAAAASKRKEESTKMGDYM